VAPTIFILPCRKNIDGDDDWYSLVPFSLFSLHRERSSPKLPAGQLVICFLAGSVSKVNPLLTFLVFPRLMLLSSVNPSRPAAFFTLFPILFSRFLEDHFLFFLRAARNSASSRVLPEAFSSAPPFLLSSLADSGAPPLASLSSRPFFAWDADNCVFSSAFPNFGGLPDDELVFLSSHLLHF